MDARTIVGGSISIGRAIPKSEERRPQSRAQRHRVHFQVRYGNAEEFLIEYVENLSVGGLFIRGAFNLEPLSEITVELDLPGYKTFSLRARVAHILTPDAARSANRPAGAGVEIVDQPRTSSHWKRA